MKNSSRTKSKSMFSLSFASFAFKERFKRFPDKHREFRQILVFEGFEKQEYEKAL